MFLSYTFFFYKKVVYKKAWALEAKKTRKFRGINHGFGCAYEKVVGKFETVTRDGLQFAHFFIGTPESVIDPFILFYVVGVR